MILYVIDHKDKKYSSKLKGISKFLSITDYKICTHQYAKLKIKKYKPMYIVCFGMEAAKAVKFKNGVKETTIKELRDTLTDIVVISNTHYQVGFTYPLRNMGRDEAFKFREAITDDLRIILQQKSIPVCNRLSHNEMVIDLEWSLDKQQVEIGTMSRKECSYENYRTQF